MQWLADSFIRKYVNAELCLGREKEEEEGKTIMELISDVVMAHVCE